MMRALIIVLAMIGCSAARGECKLDDIAPGTVASLRDGRSLILTDARNIKLFGIEAPAGNASGCWKPSSCSS